MQLDIRLVPVNLDLVVLSDHPRGSSGFGYDPIFIPEEGDGGTFGELGNEIKNQISHRKKAMVGLANLLKSPSK